MIRRVMETNKNGTCLLCAKLDEGEVSPVWSHGDPDHRVARAGGNLEVLHSCVQKVLGESPDRVSRPS